MYQFWQKCSHVDKFPLSVIWVDIAPLMHGQKYIDIFSNLNDWKFIIWKYNPEMFVTIVGMNASNICCLLNQENINSALMWLMTDAEVYQLTVTYCQWLPQDPIRGDIHAWAVNIKSTTLSCLIFNLWVVSLLNNIFVLLCSIDVIFTLSNWIYLMGIHLTGVIPCPINQRRCYSVTLYLLAHTQNDPCFNYLYQA